MQSKNEMQDFVINMLKEKIPDEYTYHNYQHTLFVQQQAMQIALHEQLNDYDRLLLNTAALWHDTGHINTYIGHEEESCNLAKEHLPNYGFTKTDINRICEMIMATKIPQNPKNLLEKIIVDADLAYLGTKEAANIAETLFVELKTIDTELTKEEWNNQQVSFLKSHHYFTKFYHDTLEPLKQAYLSQLQNENPQN